LQLVAGDQGRPIRLDLDPRHLGGGGSGQEQEGGGEKKAHWQGGAIE